MVIKPLIGSGSQGLAKCREVQEIIDAFGNVLGRGSRAEAVLAQRFIAGPEVIVESVSVDGSHVVTGIFESRRLTFDAAGRVGDRILSLPARGASFDPVRRIFVQALEVMGVRNGAAFAKLVVTPQGPVLLDLELGLAPLLSELTQACGGYSHAEAAVDAVLDGPAVAERARRRQPPRQGQIVFLRSTREGRLRRGLMTSKLMKLASSVSFVSDAVAGNTLARTVDSLTSPGYLVMAHESLATLERDYRRLRLIEDSGFYDLALAAGGG